MFKKVGLFVVSIALLLTSALSHSAEHPAQVVVEDAVGAIIMAYKNEGERLKSDPAYLRSEVQELIVPHIDFERMTINALKKFWRRADKSQREELVEQFKTLLLNTYTSAFTNYSGGTLDENAIRFEPYRPASREDRAEVRSVLMQPAGDDVKVIYKLTNRNSDGTWLIWDIEVNDLSLAASYQSAFSNEIEKNGVDGLIKTLKERNGAS